jgi:hypothetical protein
MSSGDIIGISSVNNVGNPSLPSRIPNSFFSFVKIFCESQIKNGNIYPNVLVYITLKTESSDSALRKLYNICSLSWEAVGKLLCTMMFLPERAF